MPAPVSGLDLLTLAEKHIGEKYVNVVVPKDNSDWTGPWDCAEFASWVVYQRTARLYGCDNDHGNPATADAYTGFWVRDALDGTLAITDQPAANVMAGVLLLRKPPLPGTMGHIAFTDGHGGTVEAAGTNLGVRRGRVEGRQWHFCLQIPGVAYAVTGAVVPPKPLPFLLTLEDPNLHGPLVRQVQHALKAVGFSPGKLDGAYGPHTVAAVIAFQQAHRLIADGVVGPKTAKKLGVGWVMG